MKKLNDEQRKLIEDNYSLIWHLHEEHFTKFKDFDTYMDLGRMAICKAALKWDESKELLVHISSGYYVQK